MITKQHISSWLRQPELLKKESAETLEELRTAFPYFLPAQYLKAFQLDYESAPLRQLQHVFPANRVLLYHFFQPGQKNTYPDSFSEGQRESASAEIPASAFENSVLLQESVAGKDYFASQGVELAPEPENRPTLSEEKELMVVMSFSEWLQYLQSNMQKAKEEEADKKALKTMWQKQKLAAAIEEEDEEIPENVFEMAINSIAVQEDFLSESLAEVYIRQGKKEKALEMYRKLSLQNPEKNVYFARKIELLQKDIEI